MRFWTRREGEFVEGKLSNDTKKVPFQVRGFAENPHVKTGVNITKNKRLRMFHLR